MTERSDIHKYSIVNRQYSIPVYPGWVYSISFWKIGNLISVIRLHIGYMKYTRQSTGISNFGRLRQPGYHLSALEPDCIMHQANQRPPAELGVWGWPLEGAGATSAGGRWFISIHKPPASIRFAPIKHALAVTVEPFKFSPAEPVT